MADSESLRCFQGARDKLREATVILSRLSAERKDKQLEQRAQDLLLKLDNFYFNLVILGEFKRGKSTLVNALVGSALLPTAAIPLTSVTTIVRYGAKPELHIVMESGELRNLRLSDLEKYATERGNPENKYGVKVVEVTYPSPLLRDGVRIVDTPGTGSVHLHNSETTYRFLPEADAALFVLSADQPASRNELELMLHASKFARRLFFVQNKIDYLDADARAESLAFLTQTLEKELSQSCYVYPLSAKRALEAKLGKPQDEAKLQESGLKEFEKDLTNFLSGQKAKVFIESVAGRISSVLLETRQLNELEFHVAGVPLEQLEHYLATFRKASKSILTQQRDAEHIVRGEMAALIDVVGEDLKPLVANNKQSLVDAVAAAYSTHRKLGKELLVDTLRQELKREIETIFNEWRKTEDEKIAETFKLLTLRFVDRANQVIDEIKSLTIQLFNMEVTVHFEVEPLVNEDRHYYAVENPFTLALESLPLMLPDPIVKPLINSRFKETAVSELTRNAGRLRADYQERITVSAKLFLASFRTRIAEALTQIERVIQESIERQQSSLADRSSAQFRLKSQLASIEKAESLTQAAKDFEF